MGFGTMLRTTTPFKLHALDVEKLALRDAVVSVSASKVNVVRRRRILGFLAEDEEGVTHGVLGGVCVGK